MKRKYFLAFVLAFLAMSCLIVDFSFGKSVSGATPKFDTGDTAWMIVASALVLLMTPGLGFFYGGMVGKKNVISTMLQSYVAMVVVTILWVVIGYGLSFGDSIHGIIGNPFKNLFFNNVGTSSYWKLAPTIPLLLFALFQASLRLLHQH